MAEWTWLPCSRSLTRVVRSVEEKRVTMQGTIFVWYSSLSSSLPSYRYNLYFIVMNMQTHNTIGLLWREARGSQSQRFRMRKRSRDVAGFDGDRRLEGRSRARREDCWRRPSSRSPPWSESPPRTTSCRRTCCRGTHRDDCSSRWSRRDSVAFVHWEISIQSSESPAISESIMKKLHKFRGSWHNSILLNRLLTLPGVFKTVRSLRSPLNISQIKHPSPQLSVDLRYFMNMNVYNSKKLAIKVY